jgi:polysaccharide pyruvyl transferase WcaK-like protein
MGGPLLNSQEVSMAVEGRDRSTSSSRLRLFFVGDNRTNVNWGRGASIALEQLLSGSFDINGRVTGDFFDLSSAPTGYVGGFLPARYSQFSHYLFLRRERRPFAWYIKLERLFGAQDFIVDSPEVSIDNLVAHKHRYPALAGIYDQAAAADLLVLDGDGDIIFATPPRRTTLFLLAMIELGIRLKKPVFLVNSMISDCPLTGRNKTTLATAKRLLEQCQGVALRDSESLEYVQKEMPRTNSRYIPDSLFAWFPLYVNASSHPPANGDFLLPHPEKKYYWGKLDFSRPYVCIGGGALASSRPDKSVECYSRLVDAIRELGYSVYLTENDLPDSFLQEVARAKGIGIVPPDAPILMCGAVLAHARLFISGRYHPSIFASLGGTPCIFLGSHAHKMASLSRVLEYPEHREFNAFPDDADIGQIVSLARRYLDQGQELRTNIRQVAKSRYEEAIKLPGFLLQQMHGDQLETPSASSERASQCR